jgi:4-hydroxybenzoate polyprenyltransferase
LFSFLAVGIIFISVFLAWLASVVFNDIYDFKVDNISNSHRPLQKKIFTMDEYWQLGIIMFILSLVGGLAIGASFAVLLLVYQIVAWFYSAPPYRLKRVPVVATFFGSLASVIVLFIGFALFSGEDKLGIFPWRIAFMLIFGLTLSLPIKDFRDIEGDKKDGVLTIPVLFGRDLGLLAVGAAIFISFVSSVFFLNEMRLFWWAMLCGIASFWIMNAPSWRNKIKGEHLIWWMLGIVAFYTVFLASVLFNI